MTEAIIVNGVKIGTIKESKTKNKPSKSETQLKMDNKYACVFEIIEKGKDGRK